MKSKPKPTTTEIDTPAAFAHCLLTVETVEEAIWFMGRLLKAGEVSVIENGWIDALANLGERSVLWDAWADTVTRLSGVLQSDEPYHVREAFVLTASIVQLARRSHILTRFGQKSLSYMRPLVKPHLPEHGRLSARGQELYAHLLPFPTDEKASAERMLTGLTTLWSQGDADMSLLCMEYILRKNHRVTLPRRWPAPNDAEAAKGNPLWLFWGALHAYAKEIRAFDMAGIEALLHLFIHAQHPITSQSTHTHMGLPHWSFGKDIPP